ncbi:site-specific integrase [Prevotella jejuni]|uniref:site-specific integrase n=1 Tax=Prevotella jejuni TaxID=1177574 RepID=UPI001BA93640|nr:site-specific integrase [Prevotella jejuni]QUB78227.1 site-specific integrase [Prevotella jejuni]
MILSYPISRFVFDRKKISSEKRKGLIQIEVRYEKKRKWISTGIKVFKDQWHDKRYIVNSLDSDELNERLFLCKEQIDSYFNSLMEKGITFSWDDFDTFLKRMDTSTSSETFIDYVARRIEERNDIKPSTKANHRKLLTSLDEFGKILYFSDLTKSNVADYYNFLLGKEVIIQGKVQKLKLTTTSSYMKFLKVYINDAIQHDKLDKNPCNGLKVKRGSAENGRWLSLEELSRIENIENIPSSLKIIRDLFLIQCYTGMAYTDLMDFSPEKLTEIDGVTVLSGKRKKSGESYVTVIYPTLKNLLDKYNYNIPKRTNQSYNRALKILSMACNIDKPLATHWARRTCGMLMLNKGYSIEVVAKVLGHSDIKNNTTVLCKNTR